MNPDPFFYPQRTWSSEQMAGWPSGTSLVDTVSGGVRARAAGRGPVVLFACDGPCVLEHYSPLFDRLADRFRVICYEPPGTGFSFPKRGFHYSFSAGAKVIEDVLNYFEVDASILSHSCVNGYFAAHFAHLHPTRVKGLVLCQTAAWEDMPAWGDRNIPGFLRLPLVGQTINRLMKKTITKQWFSTALPRHKDAAEFGAPTHHVQAQGGCFCLSSLTQDLLKLGGAGLDIGEVSCTSLWGEKDWSHKNTNPENVKKWIPQAQQMVLSECGHFPDLEEPKVLEKVLMELAGRKG